MKSHSKSRSKSRLKLELPNALTAKAHDKIWRQHLLYLSLRVIPNAYNYVNGEMGWILPSDTQIEMYHSTMQLNKASTINADDTARIFTALVTQIETFEFEFIVDDDFYVPWFQDQESHDSINNNQVSRRFHKWHNANNISNDVSSQQIWLSRIFYAYASFLIHLTCINQENILKDRWSYSTKNVLHHNQETIHCHQPNGPSLQVFAKYLANAMDKPCHILRFIPQIESKSNNLYPFFQIEPTSEYLDSNICFTMSMLHQRIHIHQMSSTHSSWYIAESLGVLRHSDFWPTNFWLFL